VEATIRRVLRSGEAADLDRHACAAPDGCTRYVSLRCRRVEWKGEKGALIVLWDVTELHRLQEGREDFIRTISHDLRQPLTVIRGQAQILPRYASSNEGDGRLQGGLKAIQINAERMSTMISDLLESLRLESGQLQLRTVPTDLQSLACEIVERMLGGEESGRVRVNVASELPVAQADPERLERVMVNLLTNALAYSPPGSPVTLTVRSDGPWLVVAVRDEGIGIAARDLPHLFQRYYRSAVGRRPEGLGLGLYIARLVVEAHGGRIWCESTEGQGSTFSFTLPIA
jgi:signal transduction histidine kinase